MHTTQSSILNAKKLGLSEKRSHTFMNRACKCPAVLKGNQATTYMVLFYLGCSEPLLLWHMSRVVEKGGAKGAHSIQTDSFSTN